MSVSLIHSSTVASAFAVQCDSSSYDLERGSDDNSKTEKKKVDPNPLSSDRNHLWEWAWKIDLEVDNWSRSTKRASNLYSKFGIQKFEEDKPWSRASSDKNEDAKTFVLARITAGVKLVCLLFSLDFNRELWIYIQPNSWSIDWQTGAANNR
jgi:hypothetical protein